LYGLTETSSGPAAISGRKPYGFSGSLYFRAVHATVKKEKQSPAVLFFALFPRARDISDNGSMGGTSCVTCSTAVGGGVKNNAIRETRNKRRSIESLFRPDRNIYGVVFTRPFLCAYRSRISV